MIPYLYSMYDGKDNYSWFTDSPKELFNQLLRSKYRGYQIYLNYSKTDPMNLIAKLLMNYLYGRFGLTTLTRVELVFVK